MDEMYVLITQNIASGGFWSEVVGISEDLSEYNTSNAIDVIEKYFNKKFSDTYKLIGIYELHDRPPYYIDDDDFED